MSLDSDSSAEKRSSQASAARRLASQDILCRRCGYNLHSLSIEGQCPECGAPVEQSLRGNLLRYSSPEYVRSLQRGLSFILIAVLATLASVIARVGFAILYDLATAASPPYWIDSLLEGLWLACAVLMWVGWWMFTAPDPAFIGQPARVNSRLALRIAIVGFVVLNVYSFAFTFGGISAVPLTDVLWLIFLLLQFFSSLLYVEWMAQRAANERVAKIANTYMWLLPMIFILGSCILIGPLLAIVLYFVLIFDLRESMKLVRQQQSDEPQPQQAVA